MYGTGEKIQDLNCNLPSICVCSQAIGYVCMYICMYACMYVCMRVYGFGSRISLCSSDCPRTHSVDQAGLELRSTCLCLPSAGIKGVATTTTAWLLYVILNVSSCYVVQADLEFVMILLTLTVAKCAGITGVHRHVWASYRFLNQRG